MEFPNTLPEKFANFEFNGRKLMWPPPCFLDFNASIVNLDLEAQTLRVCFPNAERLHNPAGIIQGGNLIAMMDNTVGPLSYLVAPPSTTTQLNATFLRPALPEYNYVEVLGEVTHQTKNQIFLKATVYSPSEKIIAFGHASCRMY